MGEEVKHGRGFAIVRRLPVERWGRDEALVAYFIIGMHWCGAKGGVGGLRVGRQTRGDV